MRLLWASRVTTYVDGLLDARALPAVFALVGLLLAPRSRSPAYFT
jgi:hypothetical protein